MDGYQQFIHERSHIREEHGFTPTWLPDYLKPFQRNLADWSIRKGRGAILADCGLGKTILELVWAQNVVQHTNRPVLIVAPLAVSHQFERESAKFGVDCKRSADGKLPCKIVVTNYERLHYFDRGSFGGFVGDEASAIKSASGKRRAEVNEFMRVIPYRLLATATAAPNDFFELGTQSEALGYLGYQDMLTTFFKAETKADFIGFGKKTYQFRGHSEEPFWKWVCSWARACRKPSDLGFDDTEFILPPLIEKEVLLENTTKRPGWLLSVPARGLDEQREEARVSMQERCEAAARIAIEHDGPTVLWCNLNEEGDTLTRMIPGAVQVAGSMSDEKKEERLIGFQDGHVQRLVIKPKCGCLGLNWQHCHNVVAFPSHSWEQRYQLVRRCWRYGQKNPVTVHTVTTEGEYAVMRNLERKANQADRMFTMLVEHMRDAMRVDAKWKFDQNEELPSWL